MKVKIRAQFVSRIFDILAWVILAVGVLASVIIGLGSLFSGDGQTLLLGLIVAVMVLVYTGITWAGVTLAAVVAGYINQKSE